MSSFTFCGAVALAVAFVSFSAHGQSTVLPDSTLAAASPAPTEAAQRLGTPVVPEEVAAYYDDTHKDLKQVLVWMQETNSMSPQSWSLYAEARIRLKLKDYQGARLAAEQSKKLALAAAPLRDNYAQLSEEVLTQANAMYSLSSAHENPNSQEVMARTQAVK